MKFLNWVNSYCSINPVYAILWRFLCYKQSGINEHHLSVHTSEKSLYSVKSGWFYIQKFYPGPSIYALAPDILYFCFLGNTFRFYVVYTYCTRNEIFILLRGRKASICPKWACGQGTKDAFCLASLEKMLLWPQDVVVGSVSSCSFLNYMYPQVCTP